jgi:formylglycine-generating enzyme required for sulfatase activity/serine/threonine protein kinase
LAESFGELGQSALTGEAPFAAVLADVAHDALARAAEHLAPGDIRAELQGFATADPEVYADQVRQAVAPVLGPSPTLETTLRTYLAHWPSAIRQGLRRPSDPSGRTVPAGMGFEDAAELLRLLPPRPPKLRAGQVAGGEEWELVRYCGLGERSEVWAGRSRAGTDAAALKFIMDAQAVRLVLENETLFTRAFDLGSLSGLVPLRTVYPDPKRVYLEYGYAPGYDLAGVMFDWKLRWGRPMPDPATGLARRVAEVVGKAHVRKFVHRGLKPSNAILMPAEGGRFTLWVTDFGWGQVAAALARTEPHLGLHLDPRGARTAKYLAPQVLEGEPADPRDDVYAIGLIWYQLLCQDPMVSPEGDQWADALAGEGVPDEHLDLLAACLSADPDHRPPDAAVLSRQLTELPTVPTAPPPPPRVRAASGANTGPATGAYPVPGPPSGAHAPAHPNTGPSTGSFVFDPKMLVRGGEAPVSGRFAPAPGPVTSSIPANVAIGRSRRAGMVLNSIGMTFANIPAGRYMMGSESDADHTFVGDELPQHPVRISRPFSLSIFPVTQVEFRTVMGRNPSYFCEARKGTPSHPVESVTWFEAQEFCSQLTALPDEVSAGRRYLLPTEAEWEYACRAGTRTPFWCGDKLSPTAANFAHGSEKNRTIPSAGSTLPVGQFRPNLWGLFDMHGNVAEWVSDWYSDRYYAESPIDDPTGPASGSAKVTRGGCWQSLWSDCRSAARAACPAERGTNRIGFRVVMLEAEG